MINHLEVSTITALVCLLAAAALRRFIPGRSGAALRHLILLIGVLRFAAYTPWLSAAGARLVRFIPAHTSPAPRLVHVTVRLLIPAPRAPVAPAAPAPHDWRKLKEAAWWLWYAGAALGLGAWLRRLSRPVRSIRDATFWERDFFLQVASNSGMTPGMQERVELGIVPSGHVPGAQGWLRPRVLLPDGLMNQLTETELEPVLAHELAHLRRRDPLTAGVVRAVASVFWFHPLLWWMERRLLAERETACDETVLAEGAGPHDYVAGIAKVCRSAMSGAQAYAGITGANLTQRIEHILSAQPRRCWPRFIGAIPVTLALAAALIPVAGGLLQARTAKGRADGLYRTAEALRRAGDLNAALLLFRGAEEGGNRAAGLQAALILDETGRWPEALLEYEKLLRHDPRNAIALNNAAYIRAANGGDLDQALEDAARAHQLQRDSLEIADTLGWIYVKRNLPDQAILTLRYPVIREPNNWTFRSHLAQALDEEADPPAWMQELRGLVLGSTREGDARMRRRLQSISPGRRPGLISGLIIGTE